MSTEVMLTTFDNPYDPFEDFVAWWQYDNEMGYNTCGKIARIAKSSEEFSSIEEQRETERAIDEIIHYDFLNIYKTVTRTVDNEEERASEETE
jgi:hypothetical protein